MIQIHITDGRFRPVVTCDACGELIRDANLAAVVYPSDGPRTAAPSFAHKGRCHDALDAGVRREGYSPGWMEFSAWAVRLLDNAGLDEERLARARHSTSLLNRVEP